MAARGARSSSDPLAPLRADLAKGIRPSYLFTGESDWVRREAVRLLRDACVPEESRQFSYEERTLDRFSDWAEIEALLRSYSFFDPRKLVHLEVGSKLDDDFRAAFYEHLAFEQVAQLSDLVVDGATELLLRKRLQARQDSC